jgi:hypothetical protein
MVDSVLDPLRVPSISLSQAEIDEIQDMIAREVLPPDFLERHLEAVRRNIFGFDHKTDKNGRPIEQGLGSPQNMTQNCIDAYKKWGKNDPGFEEHLKRMEAELVACNKARAAKENVPGKFRY